MYLRKYKQKLNFTPLFPTTKCRESLCDIVNMASVNSVYGLEGLGFDSRQRKRFIPSPVRQDRVWGLLFDGYGGSLPSYFFFLVTFFFLSYFFSFPSYFFSLS